MNDQNDTRTPDEQLRDRLAKEQIKRWRGMIDESKLMWVDMNKSWRKGWDAARANDTERDQLKAENEHTAEMYMDCALERDALKVKAQVLRDLCQELHAKLRTVHCGEVLALHKCTCGLCAVIAKADELLGGKNE